MLLFQQISKPESLWKLVIVHFKNLFYWSFSLNSYIEWERRSNQTREEFWKVKIVAWEQNIFILNLENEDEEHDWIYDIMTSLVNCI